MSDPTKTQFENIIDRVANELLHASLDGGKPRTPAEWAAIKELIVVLAFDPCAESDTDYQDPITAVGDAYATVAAASGKSAVFATKFIELLMPQAQERTRRMAEAIQRLQNPLASPTGEEN